MSHLPRDQMSTPGNILFPEPRQQETEEGGDLCTENCGPKTPLGNGLSPEAVLQATPGSETLLHREPRLQSTSTVSEPPSGPGLQATQHGSDSSPEPGHKRTIKVKDPSLNPKHQETQGSSDVSPKYRHQRVSRDCEPSHRSDHQTTCGGNSGSPGPKPEGTAMASDQSPGSRQPATQRHSDLPPVSEHPKTSMCINQDRSIKQQKNPGSSHPSRKPGASSGLEVAEARRRLLEVEGRQLVLSQLESRIQQLHQVFIQTELRVVGSGEGIGRLGTGMSQAEIYITAHGQRLKKSLRRHKKPRLLASALGLTSCVPWAGKLHRRAEPRERGPHSPAPRKRLPATPGAILRLVRRKRADDRRDI
ncbi:TMF-regulated nuclear protein 1 [Ambystoma mexicanum]|uniref:TMF-regulated nuclear protein 1 n=1 Tax=Ambystoma mexicanum TaxID=8296 RepID=UPI0037E72C90